MLRGIDVSTGEPVELAFGGETIETRTVLNSTRDLPYLSPGWFDLQVNGWCGMDWNSDSLTPDEAEQMCSQLAASGTTRLLATVITASREQLVGRLSNIRKSCEASTLVARMVAGIHVEGPFISSEDGPRGAHDRVSTRDPSVEELNGWVEASGNRVRMVTLAPERQGAADFISELCDRGIVPAIGHTAATTDQIRAAAEAGARFSTHLGNGISEEIHRHDNPLWPQLAEDRLMTGTIADGFHLPVEMLQVIAKTKGTDGVVVVSDATAPGGRPAGTYGWSGMTVEVSAEGRVGLAGTPYLAGAGHLLDRGVKLMSVDAGMRLRDVLTMVTANPHRLLGHAEQEYALHPGCRADVVAFRVPPTEPSAMVEAVVLGGEER